MCCLAPALYPSRQRTRTLSQRQRSRRPDAQLASARSAFADQAALPTAGSVGGDGAQSGPSAQSLSSAFSTAGTGSGGGAGGDGHGRSARGKPDSHLTWDVPPPLDEDFALSLQDRDRLLIQHQLKEERLLSAAPSMALSVACDLAAAAAACAAAAAAAAAAGPAAGVAGASTPVSVAPSLAVSRRNSLERQPTEELPRNITELYRWVQCFCCQSFNGFTCDVHECLCGPCRPRYFTVCSGSHLPQTLSQPCLSSLHSGMQQWQLKASPYLLHLCNLCCFSPARSFHLTTF